MAASTVQLKIKDLFTRRDDPSTSQEEREEIIEEIKAISLQLKSQFDSSKFSYNPQLAKRSSSSSVTLFAYVLKVHPPVATDRNKVAKFLVSAILPFPATVTKPFSREDNGHRLVCNFKEGSTKVKSSTPVRTGAITTSMVFEIAIWGTTTFGVQPGTWCTFSGVRFSENQSSKSDAWFLNVNANSCATWNEAPTLMQMPELIKRFHWGENFELRPCDMAEFPTQNQVLEEMERLGKYKEGEQMDYAERRKICSALAAEKFKDRKDLDLFNPWKRVSCLIYLATGSPHQNDDGVIPKDAPDHAFFTGISWNPDVLKDVKKDSNGGNTELDGAVASAAASSSSGVTPVKQIEFPFAQRYDAHVQCRLSTSKLSKQAFVDIGFPGTNFLQAFGILNPSKAGAILPHVIDRARLAFSSTVEISEIIFNESNAICATLPADEQHSQVLVLKTFGDVYLDIVGFLRRVAVPVTKDYAFSTVNKHIRDHTGGADVPENKMQLDMLARTAQAKAYLYCSTLNTLPARTRGNVFNLMETQTDITDDNAHEWNFFSLSNVLQLEENFKEYRVRSQRYYSSKEKDPEDREYLEQKKKTFSKQLKNLRMDGKMGMYFKPQGMMVEVIYAVRANIDADPHYNVYQNEMFKVTPTSEASSSSSSSSSSDAASSVVEDDDTTSISEGTPETVARSETTTSLSLDQEEGENVDTTVTTDEEEDASARPKASKKTPGLSLPPVSRSAKRAPPSPKKPTTTKKSRS